MCGSMPTSAESSPDTRVRAVEARAGRRRDLIVALSFVLLTLAFAWPLPVQMSTHLLGRGTDPELLMWALGWDAYAFLHQPLAIFDANIFYPSRYALAYSENMIGSALIVAPVIWATGDLVLATNLVQLSSVALSAFGAYLLARRLGLDVASAVVAGLVFGFAPARFFRMPQAHLTTIQWIPFCLAYLHAYFSSEGRPTHLKLAAAFFAAQALASGHGAVFLTVAAVALVLWQVAGGAGLNVVRRVRDLGVTGAILLLPALLLLLPYRAARTEVPNLRRVLDDHGSSLSSYFSSPVPFHQWLLAHAPGWVTAEPPDAHLFVGVIPLVLALVAVVAVVVRRSPAASSAVGQAPPARRFAGWWRGHPVLFYAGLALVSFWFTLGPPIGLWQWTYWMPVFSFLRVPSRFVLLEILALAILSGYGAQWLAQRVRPERAAAVVGLAGLLLVVEFAPWGMRTIPFQIDVTSADRWLDGRPKPFVVAEFPVPRTRDEATLARRNTLFMQHSTAHWQKIVHGYSGVEPHHYTQLQDKLARFPDDESLDALVELGVTYVVMHPYLYEYDESDLAEVDARFEKYRDWLRVEYVSREGRVYSLRRPTS
jgi:hypothetical protein